jgi:osmotically-inducible protein OsmY
VVFKLPFFGRPGSEYEDFSPRFSGLRSAVASALAFAEDLDATCIEVTIAEGMLVLEGSVPDQVHMDKAMDIALSIAGTGVLNRMWRMQH